MFILIRRRTIRLTMALLPSSQSSIAHCLYLSLSTVCGSPACARENVNMKIYYVIWVMWWRRRRRRRPWWRLLLISWNTVFFLSWWIFGCGLLSSEISFGNVVPLWEPAVALRHFHCARTASDRITIDWRALKYVLTHTHSRRLKRWRKNIKKNENTKEEVKRSESARRHKRWDKGSLWHLLHWLLYRRRRRRQSSTAATVSLRNDIVHNKKTKSFVVAVDSFILFSFFFFLVLRSDEFFVRWSSH